MPRNTATAIQNNFTGGFVTQATALNFPPNAAIDQDNCVFSERGIVSRRLGIDAENGFALKTADRTEKAQTIYHWKNASGDGNINLVVQQNGDTLFFYNTAAASLSAGISANTVSLTSFQSSGSTSDNLNQNECQFATGLGYLFVAHPYCDPFYVQFNSGAGTFTASIITFTIRDLIGINEAVLVDNRPSSLTANHNYNLLNQGWDTAKINTMHTALSTTYPSNADVWWIFKDSTDTFAPATTLASNSRGSTPAPKGFIRLNPWNTARQTTCNTQTGVSLTLTGSPDQTSGTLRPSVIEFHAGRCFYAGVNAQGYNGIIYFTKIIQRVQDFGSCMSDNDPTSETLFDFLPSDGGTISIPQAGTIYRLVSIGATLLVFGANGVWSISGSVGIGFTATDYTVTPVAAIRSISGSSFVVFEGAVAWWNATGIWICTQDNQKGLSVTSMTDDKIKDFYLEDIPTTAKRFAKGAYNPRTHTIQWLYRSLPFASLTETYTYDTILTFNTLINAFYTWSLNVTDNSPPSINGIVVIEGAASVQGSDTIVDNGAATVVDNLGNPLVTYSFAQTTITTATKYLASNPSGGSYQFTFAESFNTDYEDWNQLYGSGIQYESSFTTGYNIKTQGERNFQTNYIFVFTDTSEVNSGYYFQSLWNYGNTGNSGTWSQRQTINQIVDHTEVNFDASRRRLKVRGSGTSVQFKFTSRFGLPFFIIGWSTFDTANASV